MPEGVAMARRIRVPAYVAESRGSYEPVRPVRGAQDVYELCASLAAEPVEVFQVVLLDARHDAIGVEEVSRGTLQWAAVHPREVFRPAVVARAAAIVVAHNHPSGDPEPSADDVAVTRRLAAAGEILGIRLLDHVVVARAGRFVSLRERGHVGDAIASPAT
jgi:DNA repair protein RadC